MLAKQLYRFMGVIVLCAVFLSACGGAPAEPAAELPVDEPVATEAQAEEPAAPEAVPAAEISGKLTVWCWEAAWEDSIVASGMLDAFKAEYPNVEIETVIYSAPDVYQKLPLALQAGVGGPDIACVESSNLAQFVSLGGLADLTERVQPYKDKMNSYKWADTELEGSIYAMPWDSGPVVTYYRRDVFEAAGLPSDPDSVSAALATWDDYFNVCKTIKEKTGSDCFSNNKANNSARLYEMVLWQQGLGYYNDKGEVTVDSPENIATLEVLKKFWDANLVSDQLEWTDGWYAEMAALDKPVATLVEAAWMGVFLKSWIAPGTEGKWGVALMPAFKESQVRTSNDGGSNLVILEQSQNKETAWALVEFLVGRPESQIALFKTSDFFPSLETTYTDPVFNETDPFFADQAVRKTYVETVKIIPVGYVYGPYYREMHGFVQTAIQKVATGQMSVEEALKEAADSIRAQTGMP